jgi:hypothetical protein
MQTLLAICILAAMRVFVPACAWSDTFVRTADAFARAAVAEPLPGPDGRPDAILTAATLVLWAKHESTFKPGAAGDSGASTGIMQVSHAYAAALLHRPVEDVRAELLNPETAAPIWLAVARESFRVCKHHPYPERLAQLAYGPDCDHRLDLARSRNKETRALLATAFGQ